MAVVHKFKSQLSRDWAGKPFTIRMHVVPTSRAVEDAMELWVDQVYYRSREYSMIGGRQTLAADCIRDQNLRGEDLECFIAELKARREGLDYDILRQ